MHDANSIKPLKPPQCSTSGEFPLLLFPSTHEHLGSAVVVKQRPHRLVGELLQQLSQLVQGKLLDPVLLGVPGGSSTARNGPAVVVHAAISVPDVVRDVDAAHVVLDDPAVRGRDRAHQDERSGAPLPEKFRHIGLVDPPSVLVEFGVLRNHVCQGESGVATWNC